MHPEASRRDDLTCSAVQRQPGIVQEALRVALLEQPSLRQTWPEIDSLLEGCARMRDWEHPVALADLVGFMGGDLKVCQGKLAEGVRLLSERDEVGLVDYRQFEEVGI